VSLPDEEFRLGVERQVASLAAAILDGREPIVANAARMSGLLSHLDLPLDDEACIAFVAIGSETDHLPVGSARQHWDPKALAKKDQEIARAEEWAKGLALAACDSLLKRFGRDARPYTST
jgi:hypothetical protein